MTNKEQLEWVIRRELDAVPMVDCGESRRKDIHAKRIAQAALSVMDATDAQQERLGAALEVAREALASVYCDMHDSTPLPANVCEEVDKALTTINEMLQENHTSAANPKT